MKSLSRVTTQAIQPHRPSHPASAPVIEGQYQIAKPRASKAVKIPFSAWAVLVSSALFQLSLYSLIGNRLLVENFIWFIGGAIVGMMLATFAVGLFCYLIYHANKSE